MNPIYWPYPVLTRKGCVTFFTMTLFLITSISCFGTEHAMLNETYALQAKDTLTDAASRLSHLEQLVQKVRGKDKKLYQQYVTEYIPLALQLSKHEKAIRVFVYSQHIFRGLKTKEIYLDLGSQIEQHLHKVKDVSLLSKFYLEMGYAFREFRQKEQQIKYFSKAILKGKEQDSLITAEALFIRGQTYAWSGKFLPAINDLRLAIDYYKALDETLQVLRVESVLLLLLTRNGFGDEAVARRLKLIEDFKKTAPNTVPVVQYLNLASDFETAGDLKNYEKYLLKSIELVKERKSPSSNRNYVYVTAYALLSELYLEKDLVLAKHYLDLSKNHIIEGEYVSNAYHILIYQINRAKYLMSIKKYKEAKSILKRLIEKRRIKEAKQLAEVCELMGNIYKATNENSEALKYYLRFQKLKDSVFSVHKTNMLSYYQILYETEKKESEIASQELDLQSQQQVISAKERQQYYFVIGLLVLLLILIGLFFFIKRIRTEQRKVAESLIEKELLLKEIHHRVKNNLQIVYGLMYKQARISEDHTFKSLMEDAQGRIKSMAMVHQKLYQNNNFSKVDMKGYISELVKDIDTSFSTKNADVDIRIEMPKIRFHMDIAIPLGLILNELITNIYKHAFRDGKGNVLVAIEKIEDRHQIKVKDNGMGLPEDLDIKKSTSLGMNLVTGLCHQIRASLDYKNNNGSEFTILLSK